MFSEVKEMIGNGRACMLVVSGKKARQDGQRI